MSDLNAFIKAHEAKLQSKLYAHRYEWLARVRSKPSKSYDYHYRADGYLWRDEIAPDKSNGPLTNRELRFFQ